MRSMTGFGAASIAREGRTLRAEVRAVNHRFLQLKLRVPSEFGYLEPELEKLVRARVERGSLALSVHATGSGGARTPHVDFAAAARMREQLERLARENGLEPKIDLATLNSVADFSPYEGYRAHGWAATTVAGGEVVYDGGEVLGRRRGRYLPRTA